MSSELTHEDVERILRIIDEAKHLEELDLAYGDFHLHIRRNASGERSLASSVESPASEPPARAPATSTEKASPAAPALGVKRAAQPVPAGMVAIRASMLGTFYRSPSPGEKPFVEVGQWVKADDTVCLIEVMKLFNSIKAGVDGRIAEIRAENASLVEYNEVLIVIEPAKA